MDCNDRLKAFAVELFKINAIKFGQFKMKIGLLSPIYCDLRMIVSYPKVLDMLSQLLIEKLTSLETYQLLCGVPYTALPIATAMSIKTNIPMVLRRKEAKNYGTKKIIEGNFKINDNCLIVEDVITSGSSILETVKDLKETGLNVTDAVVVLNREQGGAGILQENGVNVFCLLTISQLMQYLLEGKYVEQKTVDEIQRYLQNSQTDSSIIVKNKTNRLHMPYIDRIPYTKSNTGKKLFQIMHDKQTNLCVAADLTSSEKILILAEQLGPHICIFKTHVDIIEDYSIKFTEKLKNIAKVHNFLIMEDRKFADIGQTVSLQFSKGIYQISSWADLITVHSLPGKGIIQAIIESGGVECGIFLLAEMSSAGNLITETYTTASIKLAEEYPHVISGIVGQSCRFVDNPGLVQLTPGIQFDNVGDKLGQQYNSPENVVLERGADIGVVGRGIIQADNFVFQAERYKKLLWEAYLKRIKNLK